MSKKVLLVVWGGVLIVAVVLGFLWWQGRKVASKSVLPITTNQETAHPNITSAPTSASGTSSAEEESPSEGEVIEEEETVE